MEELLKLCGTYGFPMVVSLYLLVRLEQRMSDLTRVIDKVVLLVERMEADKN